MATRGYLGLKTDKGTIHGVYLHNCRRDFLKYLNEFYNDPMRVNKLFNVFSFSPDLHLTHQPRPDFLLGAELIKKRARPCHISVLGDSFEKNQFCVRESASPKYYPTLEAFIKDGQNWDAEYIFLFESGNWSKVYGDDD